MGVSLVDLGFLQTRSYIDSGMFCGIRCKQWLEEIWGIKADKLEDEEKIIRNKTSITIMRSALIQTAETKKNCHERSRYI